MKHDNHELQDMIKFIISENARNNTGPTIQQLCDVNKLNMTENMLYKILSGERLFSVSVFTQLYKHTHGQLYPALRRFVAQCDPKLVVLPLPEKDKSPNMVDLLAEITAWNGKVAEADLEARADGRYDTRDCNTIEGIVISLIRQGIAALTQVRTMQTEAEKNPKGVAV